ncbi:MAG: signal peptidase I [Bdellovibrio sp.]|nr:signal peptidase I [Bdellovibrio sp.]
MKWLSNIYWILAALLAAVFVRSYMISVYKIPTHSMAPTLLAGDFILASQMAYNMQMPWSNDVYFKSKPVAGDLVVFQFSSNKAGEKSMAQYLKRVVAIAGDEIEIQHGKIVLNGKPCQYDKSETKVLNASVQVFNEICGNGPSREVIFSTESEAKNLASYAKEKVPENEIYVVGDNRSVSEDSRTLGSLPIDQIASKVSFIWLSYGSTQDFISGPNQIRWNRILTKPR